MTKQDYERFMYLRYYLKNAPEVQPLNGNLSKAERVELDELIAKALSGNPASQNQQSQEQ